jgi:hypothetical protein
MAFLRRCEFFGYPDLLVCNSGPEKGLDHRFRMFAIDSGMERWSRR